MGFLSLYLHAEKPHVSNYKLIGEYECRLDNKSRIILPSGLKKQINPDAQDKFVVTRGMEVCLVLYPWDAWEEQRNKFDHLNLFDRESRQFMRAFQNGANEILLDNQSRLLLPKKLLDYATIDREIILFAYSDRIEIWDKKTYEEQTYIEPKDYAELAERVMVNKERKDTGNAVS